MVLRWKMRTNGRGREKEEMRHDLGVRVLVGKSTFFVFVFVFVLLAHSEQVGFVWWARPPSSSKPGLWIGGLLDDLRKQSITLLPGANSRSDKWSSGEPEIGNFGNMCSAKRGYRTSFSRFHHWAASLLRLLSSIHEAAESGRSSHSQTLSLARLWDQLLATKCLQC